MVVPVEKKTRFFWQKIPLPLTLTSKKFLRHLEKFSTKIPYFEKNSIFAQN